MEHINSEMYVKLKDRFDHSWVIKDPAIRNLYLQEILEVLSKFERKNHSLYEKYKTAPASTKYHGVYDGALFDHSFNVCFNLLEWMYQHPGSGLKSTDCIIVGMFHDLCKAELYTKENGKYTYNKQLVKHHAKGSLDIMRRQLGMKVTTKQKVMILLHMSSWHNDEDVRALNIIDRIWLMNMKHLRLLQAVNWADMKAVQDEVVEELKK